MPQDLIFEENFNDLDETKWIDSCESELSMIMHNFN